MEKELSFLEETLEFMENHKITEDDIICVVGFFEKEDYSETYLKFGFEKFKELANFMYDRGYGINEIPLSLKIYGKDFWIERQEYDGSEWWEIKRFADLEKIEQTEDTEKILQMLGR